MAKIIKFRGFEEERIRQMNLEEFSSLVSARARRSLKRGFSARHKKLIEMSRKAEAGKPLRTHCRDTVVIPEFIGKLFLVYNGKEYVRVEVTPEMLGRYLGEFATTRRRVQHSAPGMGATRASKYVALK